MLNIVWIESIYHTSVASASVLFTTNPLFMAIIGFSVLGERLGRATSIAIVVSVVGATLIGWGDASNAHFPLGLFGNGNLADDPQPCGGRVGHRLRLR